MKFGQTLRPVITKPRSGTPKPKSSQKTHAFSSFHMVRLCTSTCTETPHTKLRPQGLKGRLHGRQLQDQGLMTRIKDTGLRVITPRKVVKVGGIIRCELASDLLGRGYRGT